MPPPEADGGVHSLGRSVTKETVNLSTSGSLL
jgi:hypothetical protein